MGDDRIVWWTEDLPRHVMEIANASTGTPIKYEMLRDAAEELTKLRAENERLIGDNGRKPRATWRLMADTTNQIHKVHISC